MHLDKALIANNGVPLLKSITLDKCVLALPFGRFTGNPLLCCDNLKGTHIPTLPRLVLNSL